MLRKLLKIKKMILRVLFPLIVLRIIIQMYLRDSAFQQKENYGVTQQPGPDKTQCVHKSGNAVNNDRIPPGAQQSPDIIPECAPISSSTCCKHLKDGDHPAASAAKRNLTIRARDYKPLELPEPKSVCSVCGKKGSSYVEKFTAERKARPRDQQDARRICRTCYKEAVKAEQMASVPLPGTIDVSRCTRVTAEVGKCSVCGLERSGWIDRTTHVLLCEHCYGREVRGMLMPDAMPDDAIRVWLRDWVLQKERREMNV